jgi:uncharacterized delta-60 repeat protein
MLARVSQGSRGRSPSLVLLAFVLVLGLSVLNGQAAAWVTNSPMASGRQWHTATLLPSGKVLVAGGVTNYSAPFYLTTATAQLYDPASGKWTTTASMIRARALHTATLLPTGKVLVAGGYDFGSDTLLATAELYDPATGTWSATGSLTTGREEHRAVLLSNGQVLVVGGTGGTNFLCHAELYDPVTGEWTATGTPAVGRSAFTLMLLPGGRVLMAGGADSSGHALSDAETYSPDDGLWTSVHPLNVARLGHTASLLPNGKVLVAGGVGTNLTINSAELFDPAVGTWTLTNAMNSARDNHTASMLPNGRVLVAGGNAFGDAEVYDPASGSWTGTGALNTARYHCTATLLASGQVLAVGGVSTQGFLASTEVYDWPNSTWAATGPMLTRRGYHTATMLPAGRVLVAGGSVSSIVSNRVELYDPGTAGWTATGPLNVARRAHTATLLPSGRVLVAAGLYYNGTRDLSIASAEIFDPAAETWTMTGALTDARDSHTATLLPTGKVLVAGGYQYTALGSGYLASAEVFDPATRTWTSTSGLNIPRGEHTATLLGNGKVLAAGGYGTNGMTASAELFDPATRKWALTGALNTERYDHTATLLPNGKVLVAGGDGMGNSAELYDPITERWTATGDMKAARFAHTAMLLPNGKVLVSGGMSGSFQPLYGAELYDPARGTWTAISMMTSQRAYQTASLLPDGKVLVAGGNTSFGNAAELYDAGLGFSPAWRPQISAAAPPLGLGDSLIISGSGFRGLSGGSGGNLQDSATDYPLVQLRSLESGQSLFLLCTNWQTNSFTSAPVWGFPPGYALATVFVNGIPSTGSVLNVSVPVPTSVTIIDPKALTGGAFQFRFTNSVGALFGVLATTNPALPLSSWTALGSATEVAPGQFQFADQQAVGTPRRFYRVRSP